MKVFVDTDVLVDFVCRRENHYDDAKSLFALGYAGTFSLMVSAISIAQAVNIAQKYGYTDIRNSLFKLTNFVTIVELKPRSVVWALTSRWTDYEDAVQYNCAQVAEADCIVTRRKDSFAQSAIPVLSVSELLSQSGIGI